MGNDTTKPFEFFNLENAFGKNGYAAPAMQGAGSLLQALLGFSNAKQANKLSNKQMQLMDTNLANQTLLTNNQLAQQANQVQAMNGQLTSGVNYSLSGNNIGNSSGYTPLPPVGRVNPLPQQQPANQYRSIP